MEIRNNINNYGNVEDDMDDDPPNLTIHPQAADGGYTTQSLTMADEEEEEEPPLAIASVEATMDTSITTP